MFDWNNSTQGHTNLVFIWTILKAEFEYLQYYILYTIKCHLSLNKYLHFSNKYT